MFFYVVDIVEVNYFKFLGVLREEVLVGFIKVGIYGLASVLGLAE